MHRQMKKWILWLLFISVLGCKPPAPPVPESTVSLPPPSSPTVSLSSTVARATSSASPATPIAVPTVDPAQLGTADAPIIIDAIGSYDLATYEQWADRLSKATGLHIEARVIPEGTAALDALRDGATHIRFLDALSFLYGQRRGWVVPGVSSTHLWDEGGPLVEGFSFVFITRRNGRIESGHTPEVLHQLEGLRPCWRTMEDLSREFILLTDVLPKGILAQQGVMVDDGISVADPMEALSKATCDFVVDLADAPHTTPEHYWADAPENNPQAIYVTPQYVTNLVGFSSRLPATIRDQLTQAMLDEQGLDPFHLIPFEEARFAETEALIEAAGVDVDTLVAPWLNNTQAATPRGVPPKGTLVVDVAPQGGIPFLPFFDTAPLPLNRLVLPAIYAELVRWDASGTPFPYLAENIPTLQNQQLRFVGSGENERLEIEFRLRPTLKWQDDTPLTADDIAFSWALVMQPAWPGSHRAEGAWAAELYVTSVEAPTPDRVIFRFMSQHDAREAARTGGIVGDPSLYADLAQQSGPVVPLNFLTVGRNVFPRHLLADMDVEALTKSDFARRPVFAGPYRLVEGGSDGTPVVLEAWDGFALGVPDIPRVILGATYYDDAAVPYWQEPNTLGEAMAAGRIQAQLSFPAVRTREGEEPREYDALAASDVATVEWVPRDVWGVLDFNLDNPHLADRRVRQAIANAINRQALIDEALRGHGSIKQSYLPTWHPLYAGDEALPRYGYDPEQARRLLREAGYDLSQTPATHPARGPLTLHLATMDVASYPRRAGAALIQEQLAAVGIQVEVAFYEWADFEAVDCHGIRNGRQFDLGMAGWIGGAELYPLGWVQQTTAIESIPTAENGCPMQAANWSGWRDAHVQALLPQLADGRLALEHPDRYRHAWAEHQRLWATELPSLPLFEVERPIVLAPAIAGIVPSPFAFDEGVEDTWNIYDWRLNDR